VPSDAAYLLFWLRNKSDIVVGTCGRTWRNIDGDDGRLQVWVPALLAKFDGQLLLAGEQGEEKLYTDATNTTLDPFDPANLRLGQSFVETAGVKKLLGQCPFGSRAHFDTPADL
jgi:hypothetical protein